ncbi:sialate O-acetylesterase [Pedobacter helvus]|uniref:Sialate O-acetylesterase n=1 Tax=Pedobacter helvus TaxID=2563444 RepID=A0ABW9JJF8_9SPHI|nr:sialate O-acetylesterase [Pedobacter ureilyticus]
MKKILLLITLSIIAQNLCAKITLANFFASGMVLQQQSQVSIWGKSTAKSLTITTSWDKKKYTLNIDADGRWKTKLSTPKAGGPFSININDGEETTLNDIWIGEVWLVSGQSNMEMPVQGFKNQPVLNSAEIFKNATNKNIRLFRTLKEAKGLPADNMRGNWQVADSAGIRLFSAVGYLFAVELQRKLNVPIGIIQSAWGGTNISSWMSAETFKDFEEENRYKLKQPDSVKKMDRNAPTALFNGMINPLVGYGMKGVLWYQGEHNHREPSFYAKVFPVMVKDWRKRWGLGDFPFYYVELAPNESVKDGEKISLSALFREMQYHSQFAIPNAGMSVTLDAGEQKIIHPANKPVVAKRLAAIALNKTYGFKEIPFAGPSYHSHTVKEDKLILDFNNVDQGIKPFATPSVNFELAGVDQVFYPAKAEIKGNKIVLQSDKVKQPVAARYAFKMWVTGDFYNTEGLPASSFRTDDWFAPQYGK